MTKFKIFIPDFLWKNLMANIGVLRQEWLQNQH